MSPLNGYRFEGGPEEEVESSLCGSGPLARYANALDSVTEAIQVRDGAAAWSRTATCRAGTDLRVAFCEGKPLILVTRASNERLTLAPRRARWLAKTLCEALGDCRVVPLEGEPDA